MKKERKRLIILILTGALMTALALPFSQYMKSRGISGEAPLEMAFYAGCLLIICTLTVGYLLARWLYRKIKP
jgi:predicted Na+-dependent transporter